MKKYIIAILLGSIGINIYAQDVILLKSADEINGKIVEISISELKYQKAEMPDGPLYTIPLSDVFSVTYANGTRESFQDKRHENTAIVPQTNYDKYPYPPVSKAYNIGEIFDEGGVRGVVIHTTDNGRHGLILSLIENEEIIEWGGYIKAEGSRKVSIATGARSKTDGWENTKVIAELINNSSLTWDDFPAFKFCRDLGYGWYLPAIDELQMIYNLTSREPKNDHTASKCLQDVKKYLKSLGETGIYDHSAIDVILGLETTFWYPSSTECDVNNVWPLCRPKEYEYHDKIHSGTKGSKESTSTDYSSDKHGKKYKIRAVHRF